jgi:hydrogenase expression/formation protein HypC
VPCRSRKDHQHQRERRPDLAHGKGELRGIVKEVNLAYVPEAQVGDYVIVHVGFAISKLDEAEAQKVFEYLREMGELEELTPPQPPP